jgi:hypothetical protein
MSPSRIVSHAVAQGRVVIWLFILCCCAGIMLMKLSSVSNASLSFPSGSHALSGPQPGHICLAYDGERAEPAIGSLFAELLREITGKAGVMATVLRIDDPRGRDARTLPAELLEAIRRWSSSAQLVDLPATRHRYDGSPAVAASFRLLEWLRSLARPCDHLVLHAGGGAGYYPLLARELDLGGLMSMRVSVVSMAPQQLLWKRRPGTGASVEDLEEDFMQRGVAARADVLVAPLSVLRFMRAHHWRLPPLTAPWERGRGPIEHAHEGQGTGSDQDAEDSAATDGDEDGDELAAIARSGKDRRRSPCILLEVWSRLPPTAHPHHDAPRQRQADDDAAAQLGSTSYDGLLRRLIAAERAADANRSGSGGGEGQRPPQPFRSSPSSSSSSSSTPPPAASIGTRVASRAGYGGQPPLVSVCVVHHERGPILLQALDSIRRQTISPQMLEAIVVDDGSTSAAAREVLKQAEAWEEFRSGRWLLLRRPSRYLGAARNEAARHASGRYLYFLDDDNCLKVGSLRTLLLAAAASGAHVLTSINDKWPSTRPPPETEETSERWLPLGDAAAVGVFKNCFGDASALVRRATFEALGGFTEEGGVGHEDWELWARVVLSGYKLRVVPEPLYWYRVAGGGMLGESIGSSRMHGTQRLANHARNLRPYLQRLASWPEAQDAVRLAQGMYLMHGQS